MTDPAPSYYTRLAPFRAWFAEGFPILTYHKFGRAPRGARLRGMFLPADLLDRQLSELSAAGYRSGEVAEACRGTARTVALTIDDGFRSVRELAQPVLARHGFRATLYLVADRLGKNNDWEIAQGEVEAPLMTEAEVREWLAAGHAIGSHTCTHPWLTRLPLAAAREEIGASRRRLEDRFGLPVRDFCYPYGDWNSAIRDLVGEAGYATAVTTEFGIHRPGGDALALPRVTARYASRGWPWIRERWRRFRAGVGPAG